MSIYTIKLNDPGNDDFQLLGVVTKAGMESDAKKQAYIGERQMLSPDSQDFPADFSKYRNTIFDHTPWLVPERDTGDGKREFTPAEELESLNKLEVRVISAKLTRAFSGDSFTASIPPDHPMRNAIIPYRTGIYIFENDILIWKGEVTRVTKALSGETSLEASGMTDVTNYYCPPKQTFRNLPFRTVAAILVNQYNLIVSDFRRVLFASDVVSASRETDSVIIGEYDCDGVTPILSILKDLNRSSDSDAGHYYVKMETLQSDYSVESGDIWHDETETITIGGVTIEKKPYIANYLRSHIGAKVPVIHYGYANARPSGSVGNVFQVNYGENLIDLKTEIKGDGFTVALYE